MPDEQQLYTLREAADKLRISLSTVKRRVAAGDIPTVDVGTAGHRKPRVSSEWLREYIEAQTRVVV